MNWLINICGFPITLNQLVSSIMKFLISLKSYIDNLANDRLSFEKEILTDKDKFNEYIMTNLRTMWGIQEEKMRLQFPDFSKTVRPKLAPFLENGSVVCQNGRIRLTEKGWLVSDDVFSDLFVV